MREERVIAALDARSIYHVPTAYSREGLDAEVCKYFGLDAPAADLDKWRQITEVMEIRKEKCGSPSSANISCSKPTNL